ncbi:MAG: GGDEF domain-containing protein [Desulfosalsimonadaceae bacterium]|nr:GGDEF domain-containing protein [Desulfosalsimonadaceae bacterium]
MNPVTSTCISMEEARFERLRIFAFNMGLLVSALPLITILRDTIMEPAFLMRTLTLRFEFALILLAYPCSLKMRISRRALPWILYGSLAGCELLIIVGAPRSSLPPEFGNANWILLYALIMGPVLGIPFNLRTNFFGLAVLMFAPALVLLTEAGEEFSFGQFQLMAQPAVLILGVLHYLLDKVLKENHFYREEIERLALYDPLTGIPNRRHFMQTAEMNLKQALRAKRPICLLIMDIDHFKSINDRYGHNVGDQVIRAAGQGLQDSLRETDFAARIGGEEFAAILHDTEAASAWVAADRARASLSDAPVQVENLAEPVHFTVSIGFAIFKGKGDSLDRLMERADLGLYAAKRGGRNRVEPGV